MSVSVAAVMRQCRNYFQVGYIDGTFRITGNALSGAEGAHWVYISGSAFHSGVWEVCDGYLTGRSVDGLHDEEFEGRVWFLDPPEEFLELCKTIKTYEEKNPVGAFVQERFGEYSYTRANSDTAADMGWQNVFSVELAAYRRMFTEVG
jgi:hypothetical protein